jgi:MoaA/NifB/PqqE/SkfB family radical SAM enzyme
MRIVSHPVLCNYYVTYRCNATCSFCDIWERPSPYITIENARTNISSLKRLGVRVIDFTGGEPLLHRQLDELLLETKRQGLITTVTSNALLYPKYAQRLRGLIDNPVFEYNAVGSQLSPNALQELRYWGKQRNIYLNEAFVQLRLDGGNHVKNPVCLAGSTTIVISPENKLVLPCYHLGLKDFPIEDNLYELYRSEEVQKLIALEGRLPSCEGCAINCYMQPSFTVEVTKYWWKALPSTLKYNRLKGTWKQLF